MATCSFPRFITESRIPCQSHTALNSGSWDSTHHSPAPAPTGLCTNMPHSSHAVGLGQRARL